MKRNRKHHRNSLTLGSAAVALTLAVAASPSARSATLSENFEYTPGTTAAAAGWSLEGGTALDNWIITAPGSVAGTPPVSTSVAGDSSTGQLAHAANLGPSQIYKSLGGSIINDATPTITLTAYMIPQGTGSTVPSSTVGVRTATAPSTMFGFTGSAALSDPFWTAYFTLNGTKSTTIGGVHAEKHWYQLQLTINQNFADITQSTGSLSYKDLTAGDTTFTAVSGLQNINLGFTATNKPSLWTDWRIDGAYRQSIDNLSLTAAVASLSSTTPSVRDLGTLNPGGSAGDSVGLTNVGENGSVVQVIGYSITGADADLFGLDSFSPSALTVGGTDSALYNILFNGSPAGGDYNALLTLNTTSGDVTYSLHANVIPTPSALAGGLLLLGVPFGVSRRKGRD